MIVIDKVRLYLKSIAKNEEHYQKLLYNIYINPKHRNLECKYEDLSCADCPKNHFIKKT